MIILRGCDWDYDMIVPMLAMIAPMMPMIRIRGGNIVHEIMLVLMIRIIGGNVADENVDLADYSSDSDGADDKD